MTIFAEQQEVESQLTSMGLTLAQLHQAVRVGVGGYTSSTRFHPVSAAGTYLYHETTAALRRQVVPQGWDHDEDGGQPRVFHEGRGLSIVVLTGDENTGKENPEAEPRARHPKGRATADKVIRNSEQLGLFSTSAVSPGEVDSAGGLLNWVLLVAVVDRVGRAELSLPRSMQDSRPSSWVHRIVLPEVIIGEPVEMPETEDTGDVDVDVQWKR